MSDWRLSAKGLSDYALENLARMFEYYDKFGLVGNWNVLNWILERKQDSVGTFIKKNIQN